jgi:Ca-activated chloride channel homolog
MTQQSSSQPGNGGTQDQVAVTLHARPERRLVRPGGSFRHVHYHISVQAAPRPVDEARTPLDLSVVLDRSGSMQGDKIVTARRAAIAVLEQLSERDRVAVVVFDDRIDVVHPAAPATTEVKRRIQAELARIEARASTALHEGWLTGCRAIAGDVDPLRAGRLARCFLLTDGIANVGLTDPEQIASEAAGIRENAGIGTSTFGIGADYDEALLGPMAVAGGGQFHHLRGPEDIASTFVGELGDLLSVAASQVRLELDGPADVTTEIVSQYRASQSQPGRAVVSVMLGDIPGNEEREVVVRFGFPARRTGEVASIRARLTWTSGGQQHSTGWQEIQFSYADNQACDSETRDPSVMRWVGLHHAERAKQDATQSSRRGDTKKARERLRTVTERIAEYAGSDTELLGTMHELRKLEEDLAQAPMDAMSAKEAYFQATRASRGQKDFRGPKV